MPHEGWIASLSNGETVLEAGETPGELSAWRKLLARLKDENLKITQLRLQHAGQTAVLLSNAPGYCQFYQQWLALNGKSSNSVQIIGSVFGETAYLLVMNAQGIVWQDIKPLSEVLLHSTLSPVDTKKIEETPVTSLVCQQCGRPLPSTEEYTRCEGCGVINHIKQGVVSNI